MSFCFMFCSGAVLFFVSTGKVNCIPLIFLLIFNESEHDIERWRNLSYRDTRCSIDAELHTSEL